MRAFSELKTLNRIDVQRTQLVLQQREAIKQGRIPPLVHIMDRIKNAISKGEVTPVEKLETALAFKADESFQTFQNKLTQKYGNFALDLYGTENDPRCEMILHRGEVVPADLHDEDKMMQYRYYYVPNINFPGAIETINPNRFLRLKPKEEFPLLPLIPISPSTMKRFNDALDTKRAEKYKFRPDKARLYTIGISTAVFTIFVTLLTLLFTTEEKSVIAMKKHRTRNPESFV